MNSLIERRRAMMLAEKEYYHFIDPEVESVVANWIGDGVGTTLAQITGTTSLPVATFRGNTDIVNFDEFEQFTGLTTITGGSSTSDTGAFGGCTSLESITIPSSVTSIGAYAFYGCSNLEGDLVIPSSVKSIGNGAFGGCVKIVNLINLSTASITKLNITGVGNGTGVLMTKGSFNTAPGATGGSLGNFKKYIIHGDLKSSSAYSASAPANSIWRIKGTISNPYIGTKGGLFGGGLSIFLEGSDVSAGSKGLVSSTSFSATLHINRNNIPTATPTLCSIGKMIIVYVGDGSSRANDEAVLALYLADTNWSAQSAKLATWYDYNGEYKWYYVTDNLTNCTNTNPDAWPHITRKDSYHTQIVADDGYTLSSVQVQMYEAVDDGTTPNTPTDITSTAYNASTGEIDIASVTGNVIITAVAS